MAKFLLDILLIAPKFINWILCAIVDMLLAIWPSSATLGIPTVASILNQVSVSFPMFPWGIIAHLFGVAVALLGAVLIVKTVKILWP